VRRLLTALAAVIAAALLASCGGDDKEEVAVLLERAFDAPIPTAVVSLDLEVAVEGIDELEDPIRLQVSGPFRSHGDAKLPEFDWDVNFSGGGQPIAAKLASTSDNVFVTFAGTAYEIGEREVRRLNRDLARDARRGEGRSLAQLGIRPSEWLSEGSDEGEEKVAGVTTRHVEAKIDVRGMLADLNKLVERAGDSLPGVPAPPKLTDEQIEQAAEAVSEPVLDVYVGEDDVIRRLAANLEFEIPEDARDDVGGMKGGRISFSIEFADVGAPVSVSAPERARPIDELTSRLGGLSLGSLGVGSGDADDDPFAAYARCLEEAKPSDLEAIDACSDLLE